MRYRSFGRVGWQVSEIGFGAWAIGGGWGAQGENESLASLRAYLEAGGNFIDTAQGYGNGRSEQLIGQVLRGGGSGRVLVATKIPPSGGAWPPSPYDRIEDCYSAEYLVARVDDSLRRLQCDCLDLVQLHTWTRAWNRNPTALQVLQNLRRDGKIRAIGISTPEHDQNALNDLMRSGILDSVQVIYNIFEQEAQAELFRLAEEYQVGVIVRVALDEGALTGKFRTNMRFHPDDFRTRYFAGDRLDRTISRVEAVRTALGVDDVEMASVALRFALKPSAVSVVLAGCRTVAQAIANSAVSDQPDLNDAMEQRLRKHVWRRGIWYGGK